MYEEAVLTILKKYLVFPGFLMPSKARANLTRGKRVAVMPDGVTGGFHIKGGLTTVLYEIKAVDGVLTKSYREYQLVGIIDVAAQLRTGKAVPQVAFITTSNTIIGEGLKAMPNRGVSF